jgi:ADP-ribose pyrophosphatase YjhB (NUDIX family)
MAPEYSPGGPIHTVEAIDREATEIVARLGWGFGAFTAVFSADLHQLLLVQLGDYAAKYYGGRPWTLPGGGVAAGERPSHAAARELLEECGLELEADQLRPAGWFPRPYFRGRRPRPGELVILFAAQLPTPVPLPRVNWPETVDARWVAADFSALVAVPAEGKGEHPLQPLPRHWLYWAMIGRSILERPGASPLIHTYENAPAMKVAPRLPSSTATV